MMKRWLLLLLAAILLIVAAVWVAISQFSLSALPEPGRAETYLLTRAKHALVRRASRTGIPSAPSDLAASITEGNKLFGGECASCHGFTGRKPTDAGRWMYPRAADLGSPAVQLYSDRELFWIVRNGIRLSGMPAFGRVETDEHIWNLVHYVRTLQMRPGPSARE